MTLCTCTQNTPLVPPLQSYFPMEPLSRNVPLVDTTMKVKSQCMIQLTNTTKSDTAMVTGKNLNTPSSNAITNRYSSSMQERSTTRWCMPSMALSPVPTWSPRNATIYFLNYTTCNPNAKIIYYASDIILKIDSNAAYLASPKTESCAGRYHFLRNKAQTEFNRTLLVLAKII